MSAGAKHWALAQKVEGGSAPRILLFYLADWIIGVDQTECWPSVERLVFETGMNRKTIIKALSSLEGQGLISKRSVWAYDENKNVPKRRNVFCLLGYVPADWKDSKRPSTAGESAVVPNLERTENGTSQKRNVPNLDSDSPKFGLRKSQIRTPIVPNLGHKQGDIQGDIQEEEQVFISRTSSTSAEETNTSIPDDVPSWVTDTPSSDSYSEATSTSGGASVSDCGSAVSSREDTFELTPNEPPKPAPKPAPKKGAKRSNLAARPDDVSEEVWKDYQTLRKAKRAPVTDTVINGLRREAGAAGITLEQAMTFCIERGYQGFKADWYKNAANVGGRPQRDTTRFAHEWRQEDRVYVTDEKMEEMRKTLAMFKEKKSA